jgi:hypothetical protein
MEEFSPGAEGDGELPMRAEGLGLVSLSSVGGLVGSSLGVTDWGTSGAKVVAIEGFAGDPHNMEESPPGAEGDGLPLRAKGTYEHRTGEIEARTGDHNFSPFNFQQ